MTVSTTATRFSSTGNGATTDFPFNQKFYADADIQVVLVTIATGTETAQTLNTDYTIVAKVSDANGGYSSATVRFTTAPASSKRVVRYLDPSLTQEVDFTAETDVLSALNREFDRVTTRLQRQENDGIKAPIGAASTWNATLPTPEALTLLGWDVNAAALQNMAGLSYIIPTAMSGVFQASSLNSGVSLLSIMRTKAQLAAITSTSITANSLWYMIDAPREGLFRATSSNISALVSVDSGQGIAIPFANDTTGATGGFLREAWTHNGDVDARWWGVSTADSDNYAEAAAALAVIFAQTYDRVLTWPAGGLNIKDPIYVSDDSDAGNPNYKLNLHWRGQGGMNTEQGTRVLFTLDNAAQHGIQLASLFSVSIERMAFVSIGTDIASVVSIEADDSPDFSGAMCAFSHCYINSFASVSRGPSVRVVNQKSTRFDMCWIGVLNANEVALQVGGNAADHASQLQGGNSVAFEMTHGYVFGRVEIKSASLAHISQSTFNDGYKSGIYSAGDHAFDTSIVELNYFAEGLGLSGGDRANGMTLAPSVESTDIDHGSVKIQYNRFRYRPVGVELSTTKPVLLEGNHFKPELSTDIGIYVRSGARNVRVGPHDFTDIYQTTGARAVVFEDYTHGTTEPTGLVASHVAVADYVWPESVDLAVDNVTTRMGVIPLPNLRGGFYRVSLKVAIRNLDAVDDLPFEISLRYRDEANLMPTSLGFRGYGWVRAQNFVEATYARAHIHQSRVVQLPETAAKGLYATSVAITAITKANPAVVTKTAHGLSTGDIVYFHTMVGMTELEGLYYQITSLTADTFSLQKTYSQLNLDSSAFGAFTSGFYKKMSTSRLELYIRNTSAVVHQNLRLQGSLDGTGVDASWVQVEEVM